MANFNLNKFILGGRLPATPELKLTQSGTAVLSFTLAVSRRTAPKNPDGSPGKPVSDFINCVAWRERAEFISKYFVKGSAIAIVGSIQSRTYQDKDGSKRYATEVIVDETYFVDAKGDAGGHYSPPPLTDADAPAVYGGQTSAGADSPKFEVIGEDDALPF